MPAEHIVGISRQQPTDILVKMAMCHGDSLPGECHFATPIQADRSVGFGDGRPDVGNTVRIVVAEDEVAGQHGAIRDHFGLDQVTAMKQHGGSLGLQKSNGELSPLPLIVRV